MKRLPYSRRFDPTSHLTAILYVGDWEAAKTMIADGWKNILLLPSGEQPEDYSWPILGRRVLIVESQFIEGAHGQRIGQVLILAGALEALWLRPSGQDVYFIGRGRRVHGDH